MVDRLAEPRMLVRGVIERDVEDDAHAALMRGADQVLEVGHRPVVGIDGAIVGHVVAVIARRGKDGHQPQHAHFEIGVGSRIAVVQVGIEPADDAAQVADPRRVVVAIGERSHEDLVHEGALRRGARLGAG